ncbi:polynucleotide adenylyltransferase PcnB [Cupriavidus consociatus]|uniref:polynucleotide adenylyltransferase PcnB n=1 Tax=Cupriavidus consociatus TaxID=2821357 RepID=UPI001AE2427C|nr:polynucleotide adenylyltransferase PcnB [Cupriavidus sp. LEh21]MBP0621272.1 polynucleotide adenylyltransferase PcnB [Cupriavidus sp. LEh25]MDK2657944.1 polynucleotide adenylyltransferase PcnB [Cupriavidus sp. LEh21]
MIKKLITRLLGKPGPKQRRTGRAHTPRIVNVDEHQIDPTLLSRNAVKVTSTLQQAGYQAYIVGGAVRDLLLGIKPKDFDVATNATPEQVQSLFRRSRIIGRRFQIVHVTFYGGREQEIIEVSTFRALVDAIASETLPEGRRLKRAELDSKTHAIDASGRVLRDNVWGSQSEDAERRDFTINAMYYDPAAQTVHDYHHGMEDIRARTLRMIGDPATRYREDPVRMLRVVRFAAKTGFDIDEATRHPVAGLAELIHNVPSARLFDEMLKLLMSGHAWASLQELRKAGLHKGLLPLLDVALEQPMGQRFVQLALDNTDRRVQSGKPVSPGFLFAALLWHHVLQRWNQLREEGEHAIAALNSAMDSVLEKQTGQLAIQRRFVTDMRDIWGMQPRFEKRVGRMPFRLLESPRFRAGYDFLQLRCQSGELPEELATWWQDFQNAEPHEREDLIDAVRSARGQGGGQGGAQGAEGEGPARKKRRRRSPRKSDKVSSRSDSDAGQAAHAGPGQPEET